MNANVERFVVLCFIICLTDCNVMCLAQAGQDASVGVHAPLIQEPTNDMPAWATGAWTGDDRPYQKIEAEVDEAILQKNMTTAVLKQYQATADKKLKDPTAQFRWYYASFRAREAQPKISQTIYPGPAVIERPVFPHSYQYARVGFLVETEGGPSPIYKDLGVRLLRQNPQDYELEYHLALCFDPSRSPAAKTEALAYTKDLLRMKPNDPRTYAAIADTYYYCWSVSKSKDDATNAITALQQYLRLGPPNESKRKLAENIIKEIQGG